MDKPDSYTSPSAFLTGSETGRSSSLPGVASGFHQSTPLVQLEAVSKTYRQRKVFNPSSTVALDQVSLQVFPQESWVIVGESGCGKSTLLRTMMGLSTPDKGKVYFDGQLITPGKRMLWLRKRSGMVFQDPFTTLNPRRSVGASVIEPLEAIKAPGDWRAQAVEMLNHLELPADTYDRYPHEFSGGQRQRIALARALVHRPELLIGDEPVSALDVIVRARLLDLLTRLRRELGLTLITVTHDLAIVPHLAERIAVMQAGRIVEVGSCREVFTRPRHPYTQKLIAARPRLKMSACSL